MKIIAYMILLAVPSSRDLQSNDDPFAPLQTSSLSPLAKQIVNKQFLDNNIPSATPLPNTCKLGNDTYQVGDRWSPVLPPFGMQVCVQCDCIVVPKKTCFEVKITCKRISNECPHIKTCPDGKAPVVVEGRCCKSCELTPKSLDTSPQPLPTPLPLLLSESQQHVVGQQISTTSAASTDTITTTITNPTTQQHLLHSTSTTTPSSVKYHSPMHSSPPTTELKTLNPETNRLEFAPTNYDDNDYNKRISHYREIMSKYRLCQQQVIRPRPHHHSATPMQSFNGKNFYARNKT